MQLCVGEVCRTVISFPDAPNVFRKHLAQVSAGGLPAGNYYIVLQAGSERQVRAVVVRWQALVTITSQYRGLNRLFIDTNGTDQHSIYGNHKPEYGRDTANMDRIVAWTSTHPAQRLVVQVESDRPNSGTPFISETRNRV